MKDRILLALAIGLLLGADDPKKDPAKDDLGVMQGTWVIVSAEVQGKKIPEDQIKGFKVMVKEKKMTFPGDRAGTFELDASKTPRVIALTPLNGPQKGKVQRAIYAVEKDSLKLCLTNDPRNEDPQPPKEFATKAGDGLTFFTFKREAATTKKEEK